MPYDEIAVPEVTPVPDKTCPGRSFPEVTAVTVRTFPEMLPVTTACPPDKIAVFTPDKIFCAVNSLLIFTL